MISPPHRYIYLYTCVYIYICTCVYIYISCIYPVYIYPVYVYSVLTSRGRLTGCFCSGVDVKMQKDESSTRGTVSGRTQKPVLPQVRYHPTIQASTPADGARPKTTKTTETRTSQTQRTGPGHVDNTNRVNLVPAARPHPGGGPDPKLDQKPDQRAASDPDPDRARPRPEQVPLGLGVQVARSVVEQVEVLTRGQRTNEDWFSWRKNRITASVAHRIAHCRFVHGKSKTPPTSYLAAITGEAHRVQTRAMSWGVNMEAEAVRQYQRLKSLALARPVTVQDCGLFIDAQRPWLAASPDGIVTDSGTGKWLLCLEVKCPYKHRERRVEDACRDDNAFCLQIQDEATREPGRVKTPVACVLSSSPESSPRLLCPLLVS
uniref:YqaJ viral recombinase domain-containing protein n=1 Tax=Scophthalmus maximus TaxID=52904 RepID=A0A8D3DIJ9_SCOMX